MDYKNSIYKKKLVIKVRRDIILRIGICGKLKKNSIKTIIYIYTSSFIKTTAIVYSQVVKNNNNEVEEEEEKKTRGFIFFFLQKY